MAARFAFVVALLAVLIAVSAGERPGDVVEVTAIFRDDAGVAVIPDSAMWLVFRDGEPEDSTAWISAASLDRYHRVLQWQWEIPSDAPDSARYSFALRANHASSTITNDYIRTDPPHVWLSAGRVDSLSQGAINDLWVGHATATTDTLTERRGGWIIADGDSVTNARVFATRRASFVPGDIVGFGWSTAGAYRMVIQTDPAAGDTVYVWAYYAGRWVKQATEVVID